MQGVTNAIWNVYGKLQSLTNKDGQSVTYTYSTDGQRISKKVGNVEEWYVRDATGNVIATYKKDAAINGGDLTVTEQYKYGSSLLSVKDAKINVEHPVSNTEITTSERGNDNYVLTDANGNTKVTISDRKIQHSSDGIYVSYYTADVRTATLHSAFGANAKTYNGGFTVANFNGQRKSLEIGADAQTAQFWEYNGDVGRRWNKDQVVKDDESPYLTFGGNPIALIDPNGDDWYKDKRGENKGQVIWREGSGKQRGYRNVGATYDGYTNEGGDRRWMNGDANGKKTLWEDPVYISLKKDGGSSRHYSILPNWPSYTKEDGQRSDSYQGMLRDRHNSGLPLVQASDPQEYKDNFDFYERSWQSYQDWRSVNYAILDFASFFVPIPKVGMLRWIKFGGRAAKGGDELVEVYRVWGVRAREFGESWTTVNPLNYGKGYRGFAGLPNANTGEKLMKGFVKWSDVEKIRPALPYNGNAGGLPELLIKNAEQKIINPANIILKSSF